MLRFFLKRLGLALLVAMTVSLISFSLLFLAGDPAVALAGEGASGLDIQSIRERHGFDRPIPVQYFAWLTGVLSGDFGESYYFQTPVIHLVAEKLPVTMALVSLPSRSPCCCRSLWGLLRRSGQTA